MSEEEVEAELARIEEEIDAEPGVFDFDRIGKALMLFGLIIFVCYFILVLVSFAVPAESNWKIWNLWHIGKFLAVSFISLAMMVLGYLLSLRYGNVDLKMQQT